MAETKRLTVAFCSIIAIAEALGVEGINKLDGCWEHQVDEEWWVAVNGHREPTPCSRSRNETVPGFHAYIEYNGWPAGFVSPYGGDIVAGDAANEDSFIAACEAARDRIAHSQSE